MRLLGRFILILVVVLGLAGAGLWMTRDTFPARIALWLINQSVEGPGLDHLSFKISSLGFDRSTLSRLEVGKVDGLRIARVEVGYDIGGLLLGRVDTVRVSQVRAGARVSSSGEVSFGALDRFFGGSNAEDRTAEVPDLPAIELEQVQLTLAGAALGTVTLSGNIQPLGKTGVQAKLFSTLSLTHESGAKVRAEASLTAAYNGAGYQLQATLLEGALERERLILRGLNGQLDLHRPQGGAPILKANLTATDASVDGQKIETPNANFHLSPLGVTGLLSVGRVSDPDLLIAIASDPAEKDGRIPVRLDSTLKLTAADRYHAAWSGAETRALGGVAVLRGQGKLDLAHPNLPDIWRSSVGAGSLDLYELSLPLPGLHQSQVSGAARFGFAIAADRLTLEATHSSDPKQRLQLLLADEALEAYLGQSPLSLELRSRDKGPLRILVQHPFEELALSVSGGMEGKTENGASLGLGAQFDLIDPFSRSGGDLAPGAHFRVALAKLMGGEHQIEKLLLNLESTATDALPLASSIPFSYRLSAKGSSKALALGSGALKLIGDGALSKDSVTLAYISAGEFSADTLTPSPDLKSLKGLKVKLSHLSSRPLLDLDFAKSRVRAALLAGLPAFAPEARDESWRLKLQPSETTLTFDSASQSGLSAELRVAGTDVRVEPADILLSGVDGRARLRGNLDEGVQLESLAVAASKVSDAQRLARFTPLTLEAKASPTGSSALGFEATLRGVNGAFVLDASGTHDLTTGAGEAEVKLHPLQFLEGGLQPAHLSPAAAALFQSTSGEISLKGKLKWPEPEDVSDNIQDLALDVKNVSFTGSMGAVANLNGRVRLGRLNPLRTQGGERLAADAIDVGVPISEVAVWMKLSADEGVVLNAVNAKFAGGTVSAKDLTIPVDSGKSVPLKLQVENVSAVALSEMLDLDGLQATGTLSGVFPLVWNYDTGLQVENARLVGAESGGTLKYVPETAPEMLAGAGEEVGLMMKVLRNLIYDTFVVEVNGRPGEDFDVKLVFSGKNPEVQEGYPILLNVNLTGKLDELFRNARRSLGLKDRLQKRIEAAIGQNG